MTTFSKLPEMVAIFNRISPKSAQVVMSAAEILLKAGLEKGLERGIQIGVEQGIEKGVEQGDYQATVKHVKALLAAGMNTQFIASAFDLSAEQLAAILLEISV